MKKPASVNSKYKLNIATELLKEIRLSKKKPMKSNLSKKIL